MINIIRESKQNLVNEFVSEKDSINRVLAEGKPLLFKRAGGQLLYFFKKGKKVVSREIFDKYLDNETLGVLDDLKEFYKDNWSQKYKVLMVNSRDLKEKTEELKGQYNLSPSFNLVVSHPKESLSRFISDNTPFGLSKGIGEIIRYANQDNLEERLAGSIVPRTKHSLNPFRKFAAAAALMFTSYLGLNAAGCNGGGDETPAPTHESATADETDPFSRQGSADLTASNVPAFLNYNSSTGLLSGTPTINDSGVYVISFNTGTRFAGDLTLTVRDAEPIFTPAGAETITGSENSLFSYQPNVVDLQGDIISYSTFGTLPAWATFSASTGLVSGTPNFSQAGTSTFGLIAQDEHGYSSTKNLIVNIADVNRAPNTFTMAGETDINEGDMTKLVFSNFSDPDGDSPLVLSITNAPAGATFDSATRTLTWITNFTDGDDAVLGYKDYSMTSSLDDLKGGVTTRPVAVRVHNVANPDRILAQDENFFLYSMLPDGTDLQTAGKVGEIGTRARFYPLDRTKMTSNKLVGGKQGAYLEDIAGGTNQTLITDSSSTYTGYGVVVSPDGSVVAKVDNRTGYLAVHLFDRATGNYLRKLTSDTNEERAPVFSPDGQIFYGTNISGQWDICRIKADGTGKQNITNTLALSELSPDVSPDGLELACTVDDGSTIQQIVTMSAVDGANRKQVTNSLGDSGDYSGAIDPNYSPDGKKLIYSEHSRTGNTITKGDLTILYKDASGNYSESRTISSPSDIFVWPDW